LKLPTAPAGGFLIPSAEPPGMDDEPLPEPGITAERTFRVAREHTTNLFGEQADPPGLAAAADATPEEAVRVLGTPQLLAAVEFLGRESLRGTLPEGTGVAGIDAEVTHRSAAPIGTRVRVRTELVEAAEGVLTVEGEAVAADSGATVGTVRNRLRVVDRESFRDRIDHG